MITELNLRRDCLLILLILLYIQGDLVCIEGPTGSGKTSFLNAINGNLNRFSGHIHLHNVDEGLTQILFKLLLRLITDNFRYGVRRTK